MTISRFAPFLALVSATGCFDVHGDPAPLLIDNFDDGVLPADRHFDQWRCGEFNPNTKQNCECGYDHATYQSAPYSIYLEATVAEEGSQKSAGAQLYTQADVPEDLSPMNEIVFSAKFDQGNHPLPTDAPFYVELHCSLAYVGEGSSPSDLYVHYPIQNWQTSGWNTFVLTLSQFSSPWVGITTIACLEHVDGIHFSVNAGLSLGDTGSFLLHLDDIYFQ